MDSTVLINHNCTEMLGFNIKYPNKKTIKLNLLMDSNKVIIGHQFINSNVHDSQLIESTIDSSIINLDGTYRNPTYITADKGYISKEVKEKLKERNILLNTPQRRKYFKKKSPKKPPTREPVKRVKISALRKYFLSKRYLVEHGISRLKRSSFLRFNNIKDRKIVNLEAWIMLAGSCLIFEQLCKK